jgi:hypothetical protein
MNPWATWQQIGLIIVFGAKLIVMPQISTMQRANLVLLDVYGWRWRYFSCLQPLTGTGNISKGPFTRPISAVRFWTLARLKICVFLIRSQNETQSRTRLPDRTAKSRVWTKLKSTDWTWVDFCNKNKKWLLLIKFSNTKKKIEAKIWILRVLRLLDPPPVLSWAWTRLPPIIWMIRPARRPARPSWSTASAAAAGRAGRRCAPTAVTLRWCGRSRRAPPPSPACRSNPRMTRPLSWSAEE